MNIVEVKDYKDMSEKAAKMIIDQVRENPQVVLGLATGDTPKGTYQILIKDHIENGTSYQDVTTFNLDEYIHLPEHDPNSYHYFMNEHLFNHIDIQKAHTFIPKGNVIDLERECERYEKEIIEKGGIDFQVLGLGRNGHIGFNEPGTPFDSKTHIVNLSTSTREANARFFGSIELVPKQAITMGINTIMKAKEILLLVSGKSKQQALQQLMKGEITELFPASILKKHPRVTIIADKEALNK